MILWDFFKKGVEHRLRMLDIFRDSLGFFLEGGGCKDCPRIL